MAPLVRPHKVPRQPGLPGVMIKDCINVAIAAVNGEAVEPVTVIPSQIVRAENVDEYIDPANTIY